MITKLSQISVVTHCNDLGGKIWNPAIRWSQKYAVFIVLQDNQGRKGLGECWCFDAKPDALVAFLRTEVAPHFVGANAEDAFEIARQLIRRATLTARHGILASALSGIDIALWDLAAQRENRPIWQSLSDNGTGDVPLYASGGLYGENKSIATLADEMSDLGREGFRLVKMKVGGEALPHDIARVRAVLDALPSHVKLIIDGVYSYTATEALRLFESLPHERIEAFQSPTKAEDYSGMANLCRANVPVMATEAEYRSELHEKLVHDVGVAFLQTAPIACGGISRIQDMSRMVANTPTRLSLEVSSTAVALIAACQIAASDASIAHVERHTIHTVFFDQLRLHPPFSTPADGPCRTCRDWELISRNLILRAHSHCTTNPRPNQRAHQILSWLGHQTLKESEHYTRLASHRRAVF